VPKEREIRADFDRDTIVVYQAYSHAIADAALEGANDFVAPYSFPPNDVDQSRRFWWLMHRSNWGQKKRAGADPCGANQTIGLGEGALARRPHVFRACRFSVALREWGRSVPRCEGASAMDPERSLRGGSLPSSSVQVGLSRHVIEEYVADWVVEIPVGLGRKTTSTYGVPGSFNQHAPHVPPGSVTHTEPCRFLRCRQRVKANSPAKLSLRA